MIDREKGQAAARRERLAGHQPDQHAADQPGPGGGGDGVEIGKPQAGLVERPGDQTVQMLDMGARRDLRHHTAIRPVILDLA